MASVELSAPSRSDARHEALAALVEAQQVLSVTPPSPPSCVNPSKTHQAEGIETKSRPVNLDATKQRKFRSLSVSTAVSEHPDDAWMHYALAAVASREARIV
jgi:hypothetical protein